MNSRETKTTLKDMIAHAFESKYQGTPYGRNEKERKKAAKDLVNWFENHYRDKKGDINPYTEILEKSEEYIINNIDFFTERTIASIRSYSRKKYTISMKMEHFFKYLNYKYKLHIDLTPLENFNDKDKVVRRLKILKHLHARGRTRSDIAESFGISEKILSEELNILRNGIDFLGFEIKMGEIERKENTYRSLVHPIFYAAHMSEIYSLTIGLKLLSKGTVFEHTLSPLADKIYLQLTEYAKKIIDEHSELNHLYFDGQPLQFLNTSDILIQEKPFTYFLKDHPEDLKPCQVIYHDKDENKTITGTLHLSKARENRFKKVIVRTDDGDVELDINCISEVSGLEEK